MKIEKKEWVVTKNDTYVFCSSQCELFDRNNFGQRNYVGLLLPKHVFLLKIGLKNIQNHDVAKRLGGLYLLVFKPPYFIQMKFKGSLQLPQNRFRSC